MNSNSEKHMTAICDARLINGGGWGGGGGGVGRYIFIGSAALSWNPPLGL